MVTQTTSTSAKGWSPDITAFAPEDVVPEALIVQTATKSGEVEGDDVAVRVTFVTDDDAEFTAEGATIAEADDELDEVLVFTGKVSKLVKVSREQYGQDNTAGRLSTSVQRAIVKKANSAYLTQVAPTPPAVAPPAGLLNVSGIETGGAVASDLDVLVDLIATLEGNDGTPSHIVVDPVGWASLRKFKSGTGSASSLLGAGTTDAERMLLDLPVIVTSAMTAGTGMVLDRTAIAAAYGTVNVATSEHVYFASDSIAVRATWRIGWNLVHPERIGKFTVTAPA